jgi:hypothetical protein
MDKTPSRVKPLPERSMLKPPLPDATSYRPPPTEVSRIGPVSDNVKVVIGGIGSGPEVTATNDVDEGDIVIVTDVPETTKLKHELQLPPASVIVVDAA